MKKVLIVEDDIALAKSLKAALEVKDYQIEVADCYNLAIRMFQHMTFAQLPPVAKFIWIYCGLLKHACKALIRASL